MPAEKDAFADKLKALKDAYDAQLGGRIDALESALADIGAAGDAAGHIAAAGQLLELAHKIAGSAGTFGHQNLSAAAADLEGLCEGIVKDGQVSSPELNKELMELVAVCRTYSGT
jgi:HPt (histidine-containing phosphotransfer) domain-containing protein